MKSQKSIDPAVLELFRDTRYLAPSGRGSYKASLRKTL